MTALGFPNHFVGLLICAESLGIALAGGVLGILLTFPLANAFAGAMGTLFPVFFVSRETVLMQVAAAVIVGVVAPVVPAWRAGNARIVDGLRSSAGCGPFPPTILRANLPRPSCQPRHCPARGAPAREARRRRSC